MTSIETRAMTVQAEEETDFVGELVRPPGDQITADVHDVDPVCLPVLAGLDELELLAGPGMERVGDPDPLPGGQILRITCS